MQVVLKIKFALLLFSINNSCSQTTDSPPPTDCDKFCFSDCNGYLQPLIREHYNENNRKVWVPSLGMGVFYQTHDINVFSDCVVAVRYCHCEYRIHRSNPLLWLSLSAFGIIVILVFYCICRRYRFHRLGKLLSVRHPTINPIVIVPSPSIDTIASTTNSNAPFSDWYAGKAYDDILTSEAPPEYIPPPSYYDVASRKISILIPSSSSGSNNSNGVDGSSSSETTPKTNP